MALALTTRLHALLATLESDIRKRVADDDSVRAPLVADHKAEFEAGHTRQDFTTWLGGRVTQAGVAWILATVFVRFLEDNKLITPPRFLEPVGSRTNAPDDRWQAFIRKTLTANRRDWMQSEFDDLARNHPALAELLGRANHHLWMLAPSQDGVTALIEAFSERTDDGTALRWSFADPELSTRFLGDLYQDLSDEAKKRFALLQTPDFVERFILDRTLEPALDTFGVQWKDEKGGFRLIDPTVGSGHFLLGAFPRILKRWREAEPTTDIRILVQRTLDALHGTDINPFAVSIARFRLLIAALKACGITHLSAAPDFTMQLAAGDALLLAERGANRGTSGVQLSLDPAEAATAIRTDTRYDAARRILAKGFHAVVGNPPYIQPPTDLRDAYRALYGSCHREYALTCPFMERFVELALAAQGSRPAGFVGKITSNSFMKREFGKKLITQYFAKWDLTAAIDTSGAYIPGHGTPTVILFFRNQKPSKTTVRAILGIRGEPSTPDDPSRGLVWQAILEQIDKPGSQSSFVSVEDRERQAFAVHPWSLSGGGAGDVKAAIEIASKDCISALASEIGCTAITGEDDAYMNGPSLWIAQSPLRTARLVEGTQIRDWFVAGFEPFTFPADDRFEPLLGGLEAQRLWASKRSLSVRKKFGIAMPDRGLYWWEWREVYPSKLLNPLSIAFAEIATHNHFVLDRGGKVFKQTAPVIKLKPGATEDEHLALLGVLNSSTICFWLQQVCHNKGGPGGGASKDEKWHDFYAMTSTNIGKVPVPGGFERTLPIAKQLDRLAQDRSAMVDALRSGTVSALPAFQSAMDEFHDQMVFLQEELDWLVYELFGLVSEVATVSATDHDLLRLRPGHRAFELALARRLREGECSSEWFEWFSIEPICQPVSDWPPSYRDRVSRRLALIEEVPALRLLEQPEFKRRWEIDPPVRDVWRKALTERLLDRIEALDVWRAETSAPVSVAHLADLLARDAEAVQIAELLTGTEAPEMAPFLAGLVKDEHVPCAAGARYTESGLLKRKSWEATWDLQRKEDAIDALAEAGGITADEAKVRKKREVGAIPVPPKYDSKDFRTAAFWQARGKLDVPKERFVSYPGASGDKPTDLMLGWAGWDHYQQAQALVGLVNAQTEAGATGDRLTPLLQGLAELLPWIKQWYDSHLGFDDLGETYRGVWRESVQRAGLTAEAVTTWTLPKATRGGGGAGRKRKTAETAKATVRGSTEDEIE
jgi:hypothetical protein